MAVVTLIGSGNVAWHLGHALAKAGHQMESVYSRSISNAQNLAKKIPGCAAVSNSDFSKNKSSLFIVAIRDQAIDRLLSDVILPEGAIIAHTSGSVSIDVLNKFPRYGVVYPLQTFTKDKEVDLSEVPFGVEASDKEVYKILSEVAGSLSKNVQAISSEQRKVIHIAAVFACNFTNYMLSVSEKILKNGNMNLSLLDPLVKETIQKAFAIGPGKAQTGPAIRGDEKIIQEHLDYLRNEPELHKLYQILSDSISNGQKLV